jgi:hypothetical protein
MSTIGEAKEPSYEVVRDKEVGTVVVTIVNDAISYQRADVLAQGMFVVPVRLESKASNRLDPDMTNVVDIRRYRAIGWLA